VHAIAAMTHLDTDQIKVAWGEAGDIWPLEIRGDVIMASLEDAAKRSGIEQCAV
jgi:hypothetical protein